MCIMHTESSIIIIRFLSNLLSQPCIMWNCELSVSAGLHHFLYHAGDVAKLNSKMEAALHYWKQSNTSMKVVASGTLHERHNIVVISQSLYVLQWDTTCWISGREAPVYESVLWSAVVLPYPWSEERLSGEPRQKLQAPQTYNCSTQLSGEELWSKSHICVWAHPGPGACITKQVQLSLALFGVPGFTGHGISAPGLLL